MKITNGLGMFAMMNSQMVGQFKLMMVNWDVWFLGFFLAVSSEHDLANAGHQ